MDEKGPYQKSIIQIAGKCHSGCGYCTTTKEEKEESTTSVTFGIISTKMFVDDYERMMLVGWRRSGTYFYKPIMHETCCPQYTIRLKVSDFKPSKTQRQILRRVERYLETGDIHEQSNTTNGSISHDIEPNGSSPASVPIHNISISLDSATFTEEKFRLYKSYQLSVHNSDLSELTEKSFERFLADSPLVSRSNVLPSGEDSRLPFGTYHQLYRLDGRLIAVGVVDIMSTGLSSVYLFYDPTDRFLVLGKYTALKEIEFCLQHGLEYYYMGFYIHSCQKMRYKGEYRPSELLCPTSMTWHKLDSSSHLLDNYRFTPLDETLAIERSLLPSSEFISARCETAAETSFPAEKSTNTSKSLEMTESLKAIPDLSQFAPRFNVIRRESLGRVCLDLGTGSSLNIRDLTRSGQDIVERLLIELGECCGEEILLRLCVKLR